MGLPTLPKAIPTVRRAVVTLNTRFDGAWSSTDSNNETLVVPTVFVAVTV